MFRNYFKIGLRSLGRNKVYTIINLTGLAIGLACFILISVYIRNEISYDKFYSNADQIYRINTHVDVNGISNNYPSAHYPAAHDMERDYPEVINATTMYKAFYLSNVLPKVRYNDNEFEEKKFYLADPTFFSVFDFKFKQGNRNEALANANSVVLTEATASKYFGNENPLGKIILFQDTIPFTVTGVLEANPGRTHLDFDFIGTSKLVLNRIIGFDVDHAYVGLWYYSFIVLQPGSSPTDLQSRFNEFVKKYYPPRYTENNASLTIQNIQDIHLYSDFSTADMSVNGNIQYVYTLGSIGILVLIIACINFMNLSIARFSNRGKEVGMRKVMGAQKGNLIFQFLGESTLIAVFAGVIGFAMILVFIPIFNDLASSDLKPGQFMEPLTLVMAVLIVLFAGVIAGIYPSLVMAAFQPVTVLKGRHKGKTARFDLRKILVVAQFAISMILLIGTFTISDQLTFMRSKNMGFDKDQVLVVPVAGTTMSRDFSVFKNRLLQDPNVLSVTTLSHDLGQKALPYFPMRIEGYEDEQMLPIMYVGFDFTNTFNVEMVSGRFFDIDHRTDSTLAFVVNESAAKSLGWKDPIGRKISFGVNGVANSEVIGVIKDFNFDPLRSKVGPLIISFGRASVNVAIKMAQGNHRTTIDQVSKAWSEVIPNKPFSYYFLDEALTNTYVAEEKLAKIFTYFCGLAIFVASLGLFALASFSAQSRLKEIGVRKVLGATESGLVLLLYREFVILVAAAFMIGSPVAYYLFNQWLNSFAYRIDMNPLTFVIAVSFILLIAMITVGYQSITAARTNPVKVLRSE